MIVYVPFDFPVASCAQVTAHSNHERWMTPAGWSVCVTCVRTWCIPSSLSKKDPNESYQACSVLHQVLTTMERHPDHFDAAFDVSWTTQLLVALSQQRWEPSSSYAQLIVRLFQIRQSQGPSGEDILIDALIQAIGLASSQDDLVTLIGWLRMCCSHNDPFLQLLAAHSTPPLRESLLTMTAAVAQAADFNERVLLDELCCLSIVLIPKLNEEDFSLLWDAQLPTAVARAASMLHSQCTGAAVSSLLLLRVLFVDCDVLSHRGGGGPLVPFANHQTTLMTSQSQTEWLSPAARFVQDQLKVLLLSPSQESVEITAQVLTRCAVALEDESSASWNSWVQDHLAEALRRSDGVSAGSLITLFLTYEQLGVVQRLNQNLCDALVTSTSHVSCEVTDTWAKNYRLAGLSVHGLPASRLAEVISRALKQCSQSSFFSLLAAATTHPDWSLLSTESISLIVNTVHISFEQLVEGNDGSVLAEEVALMGNALEKLFSHEGSSVVGNRVAWRWVLWQLRQPMRPLPCFSVCMRLLCLLLPTANDDDRRLLLRSSSEEDPPHDDGVDLLRLLWTHPEQDCCGIDEVFPREQIVREICGDSLIQFVTPPTSVLLSCRSGDGMDEYLASPDWWWNTLWAASPPSCCRIMGSMTRLGVAPTIELSRAMSAFPLADPWSEIVFRWICLFWNIPNHTSHRSSLCVALDETDPSSLMEQCRLIVEDSFSYCASLVDEGSSLLPLQRLVSELFDAEGQHQHLGQQYLANCGTWWCLGRDPSEQFVQSLPTRVNMEESAGSFFWATSPLATLHYNRSLLHACLELALSSPQLSNVFVREYLVRWLLYIPEDFADLPLPAFDGVVRLLLTFLCQSTTDCNKSEALIAKFAIRGMKRFTEQCHDAVFTLVRVCLEQLSGMDVLFLLQQELPSFLLPTGDVPLSWWSEPLFPSRLPSLPLMDLKLSIMKLRTARPISRSGFTASSVLQYATCCSASDATLMFLLSHREVLLLVSSPHEVLLVLTFLTECVMTAFSLFSTPAFDLRFALSAVIACGRFLENLRTEQTILVENTLVLLALQNCCSSNIQKLEQTSHATLTNAVRRMSRWIAELRGPPHMNHQHSPLTAPLPTFDEIARMDTAPQTRYRMVDATGLHWYRCDN